MQYCEKHIYKINVPPPLLPPSESQDRLHFGDHFQRSTECGKDEREKKLSKQDKTGNKLINMMAMQRYVEHVWVVCHIATWWGKKNVRGRREKLLMCGLRTLSRYCRSCSPSSDYVIEEFAIAVTFCVFAACKLHRDNGGVWAGLESRKLRPEMSTIGPYSSGFIDQENGRG